MYITNKTLDLVRAEHEVVKARLVEQRRIVRQAIESGGGTHDNGMYDAALQDQRVLAQRESQLREYLGYRIIDNMAIAAQKVSLGTRVSVQRSDTRLPSTFLILGTPDAELRADEGVLSYEAPLARQLIGRQVGDVVTIRVPAGNYEVEVASIVRFDAPR